MTFKIWMSRNYRSSISDKGELARRIHTDERFPQNGKGKYAGWHDVIRDYLLRKGAGQVWIQTFEICWKEYEQCERAKSKRRLCRR